MSRRFLRPLFEFWEPFNVDQYISKKAIPGGSKAMKDYEKGKKQQQKIDAHQTFDNFFKDYYENSNSLRKEEQEFFEKHYPERVGKIFNPYQALGIDKNSDLQKIKQAYRSNALKYHPKVDNSAQAQRRFNQVARAYTELLSQKRRDDNGEDVSTKSLFEDFHNKLEEYEKPEQNQHQRNQSVNEDRDHKNEKDQDNKLNTKSSQAAQKRESKPHEGSQKKEGNKNISKEEEKKHNQFLKGAELYSESSYYEFINGQRKLRVTKLYEKDGKKLKVDRVQGQLPDGSIEVSQTFDDGTEVKNKKYIHGSKKHKQIGN